MGGFDPYSSSKGAAEIVASAFRRSFFNKTSGIALASVRAGNVIGGGDWSADRIIPDCVRALTEKKPIDVRNPKAVRPWQHVLEPLSGYILLASLLWKNPEEYDYGWNFGPFNDENHSVKEIVEQVIKTWGEGSWVDQSARSKQDHRHEAGLLDLDCSKARTILGWQPKYNTFQAVKKTVQWYKHFYSSGKRDAVSLVTEEISSYEAVLALT
jgi:CDP-glucose 4,6-dehydratase